MFRHDRFLGDILHIHSGLERIPLDRKLLEILKVEMKVFLLALLRENWMVALMWRDLARDLTKDFAKDLMKDYAKDLTKDLKMDNLMVVRMVLVMVLEMMLVHHILYYDTNIHLYQPIATIDLNSV